MKKETIKNAAKGIGLTLGYITLAFLEGVTSTIETPEEKAIREKQELIDELKEMTQEERREYILAKETDKFIDNEIAKLEKEIKDLQNEEES